MPLHSVWKQFRTESTVAYAALKFEAEAMCEAQGVMSTWSPSTSSWTDPGTPDWHGPESPAT